MTDAQPTREHIAAKRAAEQPHESFFALFGGPIAWFVQLSAGFAMASQPCFIDGVRVVTISHDWTRPAMLTLIAASCAVALMALLLSRRAYQRTQVMDVESGRTRFLALWGVYLSAGSALVTLMTAFAFTVLPRCAG